MSLLDSLTDAEAAALVRMLPDAVLAAYARRGSVVVATVSKPVLPHERVAHALAVRGLAGLLAEVAARHMVTEADVCGRCRSKNIAAARFEVWAALRERGLSYPEIGALFDRDHTTIMSGLGALSRRAA